MLKAIKEAKVHTSWTNPDLGYDEAMGNFVEHVLDAAKNRDFLRHAEQLVRTLERPGLLNALSQLLLKMASPGVADIYQGTELWDFSLVDPDNRRPVDFAHREELLSRLERERGGDRLALARRLWAEPEDGAVKLYVLTEGLALRRRRAELFRFGDYAPLEPVGRCAEQVVGFTRHWEGQSLLALVPRWAASMVWNEGLEEGMARTIVPLPEALRGKPLRNIFTGQVVSGDALDVGELLAAFPVALFEGAPT
jgi:(1->4)-alpha-D-glucan 1-alpha-D-glucosylmutase